MCWRRRARTCWRWAATTMLRRAQLAGTVRPHRRAARAAGLRVRPRHRRQGVLPERARFLRAGRVRIAAPVILSVGAQRRSRRIPCGASRRRLHTRRRVRARQQAIRRCRRRGRREPRHRRRRVRHHHRQLGLRQDHADQPAYALLRCAGRSNYHRRHPGAADWPQGAAQEFWYGAARYLAQVRLYFGEYPHGQSRRFL